MATSHVPPKQETKKRPVANDQATGHGWGLRRASGRRGDEPLVLKTHCLNIVPAPGMPAGYDLRKKGGKRGAA